MPALCMKAHAFRTVCGGGALCFMPYLTALGTVTPPQGRLHLIHRLRRSPFPSRGRLRDGSAVTVFSVPPENTATVLNEGFLWGNGDLRGGCARLRRCISKSRRWSIPKPSPSRRRWRRRRRMRCRLRKQPLSPLTVQNQHYLYGFRYPSCALP